MTTATQTPFGQLKNAALSLMPQWNELEQPTVDVRLSRIVRDASGHAKAVYERTVRLPKLRKPHTDGTFGKPVEIDGSTLAAILAEPEKWLSKLRPEAIEEAVVAYVNEQGIPGRYLYPASELLWCLLAAQRGAKLELLNLGPATIHTGGGE